MLIRAPADAHLKNIPIMNGREARRQPLFLASIDWIFGHWIVAALSHEFIDLFDRSNRLLFDNNTTSSRMHSMSIG